MPRHCQQCNYVGGPAARFCKRCGSALVDSPAVVPPLSSSQVPAGDQALRPLPPRDLKQPLQRPIGTAFSALPQGAKVAAGGAAVALVGCFLPLVSGVGENTSVIPGLVNQVPQALVLPLSAIAVVVMAWSAQTAQSERSSLLRGGVIAVSSPWALFFLFGLLAANRMSSYLGPFNFFGAGIGVGVIALALGFSASLVGGFLSLLEMVRSLGRAGQSDGL